MKTILVSLFLVLSTIVAFAAQQVEGTIVYADKKEVEVTLFIPTGLFGGDPNTEALQKGVRYLDGTGKRRKLKPDQAVEFYFNYDGNIYRFVSQHYSSGIFSRNSFLLQLIDGPVKMFEYRKTTRNSTGPNNMGYSTQTITYLLQRGDEQLNEPNLFGFKKEMGKYFADCPELVSLIEEKEFKRRDIGEIVTYYNTRCKGK